MSESKFFEIPYYHSYISPNLARRLLLDAKPVPAVDGLMQVGPGGGLENSESLRFLTKLYDEIKEDLKTVLRQRISDRKFIDERVSACAKFNRDMKRDILDSDYKTVIGFTDSKNRIVMGPKSDLYSRPGGNPVAPVPDFLKGSHVTLFGPPDSKKMAINAMNAYHRKLKDEPPIVEELLRKHASSPKWGADDEDSKTPLRADLMSAALNLTACFEGDIRVDEGKKTYQLAGDHLSLPIKRFPGLALPSAFLFYKNNPIPLHLYDFALHLQRNWRNPQALVFYVPKLENEEEAAYIHKMIATAERLVQAENPNFKLGTVRLMIVLENPRAILRTHEIMDALYPYFVGASLGWHDYLASTARIFKEDGGYRIPVKADPDIVIKYIKASHRLLADVVGSRGGISVGGMYGILPLDNELSSPSFQITLLGFIKDVLTQMKRELTGYWVAHPDFVRLGLALVEAWREHVKGQPQALETLVKGLLIKEHHAEILRFISSADIPGLDVSDPNYVRALIVADIKESDFIANNHPDEIRYNVFQSLQYLADWLSGNGCVALPATVRGVPVRVMDDLATAERSRWEVWHELHHGRFSMEDFIRIAHEEMHFIRKDLSNSNKIVQVKWDEQTARWYPIAMQIMLKLMTDPIPAEFATELLMPFTIDRIRHANDPWNEACAIDSAKFQLPTHVEKLNYYFAACGSKRFAETMAQNAFMDLVACENLVLSFTLGEVLEAASFHGNIGEAKKSLDAQAALEQKGVLADSEITRRKLSSLGEQYLNKFGFKFLISAKDKSGAEILSQLKMRLGRTPGDELTAARHALWEITFKRLSENPLDTIKKKISDLLEKHGIVGASLAVNDSGQTQALSFGDSVKNKQKVTDHTRFQMASLSKTLATAFCLEYFSKHKISLTTPVNELFQKTKSPFRLENGQVQLAHLMNHTALNLHYVKGFRLGLKMPGAGEILMAPEKYGYEPLRVRPNPGQSFAYSGGGFLVLEHLIESLEEKPVKTLVNDFFNFGQADLAHGNFDSGDEMAGGHLQFPLFAAGGVGSPREMAGFLLNLTEAFQDLSGAGKISHDTAVTMLYGTDLGSREFIGADMGLGAFVIEAGENKLALHQGANEGFRALYLQCFSGPDCGKGFVIYANGDNRAVSFIAEVAQEILRELKMTGIDYAKFNTHFENSKLSQEQIVNLGYKALIFSAFEPCRPPVILAKGLPDPLSKYNLAALAKILFVSNERFALAENLLSPNEPTYDPDLFCPQGKVMDSWESARHNEKPFHTLDFELRKASQLKYTRLSTEFHDGNQVELVQIMGRGLSTDGWRELLPKTKLSGHSELKIKLPPSDTVYSQIQIRAYPDGGLTRLGLYNELPITIASDFEYLTSAKCVRFSAPIPKPDKPLSISYSPNPQEWSLNRKRHGQPIDGASVAFGGQVVSVSNDHFGPAASVISPYPPIHMFDGFESARSRAPEHHEELTLKLFAPTQIDSIIFDFKYFVNNNPRFVSVHGLHNNSWVELAPKSFVKPFAGNKKQFRIEAKQKFTQILVRVYPDGGIHRVHVLGFTE